MNNIETVLLLMAVLSGLTLLTQRLKIPYTILLIAAGLIIGFVPSLPNVELKPDVAFLIFLPPLLYEASGTISWHEFRKFSQPISLLAIGLVFFTTTAVAVVAHYTIPDFSWPLSFVLGAVISPPDAVAATSVTRGLGLPKRIIAILEGESLVNDASALIAYRFAIATVLSGSFVLWEAGLQFVVVAGGGVLTGILLGVIFRLIHNQLDNSTVATTLSLLLPFIAYLLAEHFGTSGVLAVVSAGLYMAWHSYEIYSFQTRMQINGFWNILIFLLTGFVFILIGTELPFIVNGLEQDELPRLIGYGLLISLVAILTRIVWVFPGTYLFSFFKTRKKREGSIRQFTRNELFITSWAGMRGVVSLATALSIPYKLRSGQAFPYRSEILFITFMVIVVTLVLQSLTLPVFIKRLNVFEPKEEEEKEERSMRLALLVSSITFIESELSLTLDDTVLAELKERFEQQINYLNGVMRMDENPTLHRLKNMPSAFNEYMESEAKIIRHQRDQIIKWHKNGTYSEESIRRIEQELDVRSLSLQTRLRRVIPSGGLT